MQQQNPVLVRGAPRYRWRYHYATRTTDEHLAPEETARRLVHLVGGEFRQAHLRARDADYQVLAGTKGTTVLRQAPSRPKAALEHDRPPPLLGEHTDEILRELAGLSAADIAQIGRAHV